MKSMTLAEFAAFLPGLLPAVHAAMGRATNDSAELVVEKAAAALGHYQGAAGPFEEWAPLAQKTQEERVKVGHTPDDPLRASGELDKAIERTEEHDGHTWHAQIGVPHGDVGDGTRANPYRDIGQVALDMEMGTHRTPARSFLGSTLVRETPAILRIYGREVSHALAGHPPDNFPADGRVIETSEGIPW